MDKKQAAIILGAKMKESGMTEEEVWADIASANTVSQLFFDITRLIKSTFSSDELSDLDDSDGIVIGIKALGTTIGWFVRCCPAEVRHNVMDDIFRLACEVNKQAIDGGFDTPDTEH